ncbi:PAS domain-containing sensor histidine kinase [Methanococcoides sp. LMO-2]|uniref:histidine kinase n=1 Tax=Methanococcoides cohabitans TaxID=3136559 RepID=A0ABU9KV58_9EURY
MEQYFETIFNSVNDGILIHTFDGRFLEVNRIMCNDLGYQKDELLQMTAMDITPPELRKITGKQIAEKMEQGGGFVETVTICKDGTPVPVELNVRPIEYKGTPAVLAVARNITERKIAERKLRESEEKFKTVFESANDGIYVTALDGRLLEVNKIACKQLGYTRSELLQMRPQDIDFFADAKEVGNIIDQLLQDGHNLFESILVRKDGSTFPVEVSIQLIDYMGEKAILGVSRDMTEHKQANEAMLNAKIAAEDASRAKSKFLTNVSHELRAPLNSIIGFSEVLCSEDAGSLNDLQKRYVSNVHKSGKHLLELINEILDLSKVEAGKMELNPEKVGVYSIINEIKESMMPLATEKGIELEYDIGPENTFIVADALKLRQIIYNLVSNAIKFTERGGSVTIETLSSDDQISVLVKDTGIGISSGDQTKIFQPFVQIDPSNEKKYSGTGLGLSLVRSFVEMHGGEVWVESEVGNGSTFGFSIPTDQ